MEADSTPDTYRLAGNTAFQNKDLDQAMVFYTMAIDLHLESSGGFNELHPSNVVEITPGESTDVSASNSIPCLFPPPSSRATHNNNLIPSLLQP
jgi:hypothetical protein